MVKVTFWSAYYTNPSFIFAVTIIRSQATMNTREERTFVSETMLAVEQYRKHGFRRFFVVKS